MRAVGRGVVGVAIAVMLASAGVAVAEREPDSVRRALRGSTTYK